MASPPIPSGLRDRLIGVSVGGFRVEARVDHGGMGAVYLAVHPTLHKRVAIKLLLDAPSNRGSHRRFAAEARVLASLVSPNVVAIKDFARLGDGSSYIVMEYLEGECLGAMLRRGVRFTTTEAVAVVAQVLDGLAIAHARNVVHRDVKPDNLLLVAEEGARGAVVKLLDFGLAKLLDGTGGDAGTRSHAVLGTPDFMSPEQARGGSRDVDARADLYSVGVVLYTLIAGRPPFDAADLGAVLVAHLTTPPPSLGARPGMNGALDAAIARALAKQPADRFPSAEAMRAAIVAAIDGPLPAVPSPRIRQDAVASRDAAPSTTLSSPDAVSATSSATLHAPDGLLGREVTRTLDAGRAPPWTPESEPGARPARRGLRGSAVLVVSLAVASVVALGLALGLLRVRARDRALAVSAESLRGPTPSRAPSPAEAPEFFTLTLESEVGTPRTFHGTRGAISIDPAAAQILVSPTQRGLEVLVVFKLGGGWAQLTLVIPPAAQHVGTSTFDTAGAPSDLAFSIPPRGFATGHYAAGIVPNTALGTCAPWGKLHLSRVSNRLGGWLAGTFELELDPLPSHLPGPPTAPRGKPIHARGEFALEL